MSNDFFKNNNDSSNNENKQSTSANNTSIPNNNATCSEGTTVNKNFNPENEMTSTNINNERGRDLNNEFINESSFSNENHVEKDCASNGTHPLDNSNEQTHCQS